MQALERGETGAALKEFLAPDVVLEEFPNLLTPVARGATWVRPWRERNWAKAHVPADV